MDQDTTIDKILAEAKTIAVVGFSSAPQKAGYYVPAYLKQHGYRIIPVNPNLSEGLGEPAYAALADVGMALVNIVVALAWFGVNLLSVGLHSYGFTDSAAYGLLGFCLGELVLISVLAAIILIRRQRGTHAH